MFRILLVLCLATHLSALSFPIAFTVQRQLQHPLRLAEFVGRTGCCPTDTRNNTIGYNLISLDGFRSSTTVASLRQSASPLALWLDAFNAIAGGKTLIAGRDNSQVQKYLLNQIHQGRGRLLIYALSNQVVVSQGTVDAADLASRMAQVVRAGQLDGVSIQFDDYHAVAKGTAGPWLSTLLTTFKRQLPQSTVVLVLPVTLVKSNTWQGSQINWQVDYFVLKYYDQDKAAFTSVDALVTNSTEYSGSAMMELQRLPTLPIDLCRTLIAKPAAPQPSRNGPSYMDPATLSQAFDQLKRRLGWFGGYANLDHQTDADGSFQRRVLDSLRDSCYRGGDCFCYSN